MKYDAIKIAPYKYLIHLSAGGNSKRVPRQFLDTEHDCIIDFSHLDPPNTPPLKARAAFLSFASNLTRHSKSQTLELDKLRPNKQFEIKKPDALPVALADAINNNAIITTIKALPEFTAIRSTKHNIHKERQYLKEHFAALRQAVNKITNPCTTSLSSSSKPTADTVAPSSAKHPILRLRQIDSKPEYLIAKQYVVTIDDREMVFSAREVYKLIHHGYLDLDSEITTRLTKQKTTAKDFKHQYEALSTVERSKFETIAPRTRPELSADINSCLRPALFRL